MLQTITVIGGMTGGLLAVPVADKLGRRIALIVGGIPSFCGWVLLAGSVWVTDSRAGFLTVLLTGRFLTGLSTGWSLLMVIVSAGIF